MSRCDNTCGSEAVYLVSDPGANDVYYCRGCLPAHMQSRADSGHFLLPVEKPAKVTPKKS